LPDRRNPLAGTVASPSGPAVRLLPTSIESDLRTLQTLLEPRRILRWVYVGRLSLASAIYLASLYVWKLEEVPANTKLIASLAFAGAAMFTMVSGVVSEIKQLPLGRSFFHLQSAFDILLVTAVVHLTGGGESQFAALYILAIALYSVILPAGGGLLTAALAMVLYCADVIWTPSQSLDWGTASLWLQLAVFAIVALGSGFLSARLKEVGTGHEKLAEELVNLRLQAADILRNIRSGIITIDTHGALLHANPAASSLLGQSLDPHVGKPVLETLRIVAPNLVQALERTVHHGIRTTRAEGVITVADRAFPIGVTTTFADGNGNGLPTTATAIFQDISDQKRLDALHLRAQRLEAVAELSASLAHEIKNPLASIQSSVEQLAAAPHAGEDEQVLAKLIVRESDRLSRLLSEFLDFARVRLTRIEPVDVAGIARGAVSLAEAHPGKPEGVVVAFSSEDEELLMDGDEDLLHRTVFNLTLNAIQAVGAGGRIGVDVTRVANNRLPVGIFFEPGAVSIRVTDNGPGISDDIRDRLFEPFTTTKKGGSGLGLSIVHRAIEAHRGHVLVDSGTKGTSFTVLLPISQSKEN
jgi:two-component system sensor histidine kinase PilS (NtrC family)